MPSDEEELKGMLLDAWIDDLRNDRRPRVLPNMEKLKPDGLEEIMRLARWYKANFYPSQTSQEDIDSLAKRLRKSVHEKRLSEIEEINKLTSHIPRFHDILRTARVHLGISSRTLEKECRLPENHLSRLESGELPPHRVLLDRMIPLLHGLRLSRQVMGILRTSCLEWAQLAYSREQMQLARIDSSVGDAERLRLLQETSKDTEDALAREIKRIEQYCTELSAQLD